jgi:hypothetical protein
LPGCDQALIECHRSAGETPAGARRPAGAGAAAPGGSEHRDGAEALGLQLASQLVGQLGRQEAGLFHRLATARPGSRWSRPAEGRGPGEPRRLMALALRRAAVPAALDRPALPGLRPAAQTAPWPPIQPAGDSAPCRTPDHQAAPSSTAAGGLCGTEKQWEGSA